MTTGMATTRTPATPTDAVCDNRRRVNLQFAIINLQFAVVLHPPNSRCTSPSNAADRVPIALKANRRDVSPVAVMSIRS